MEMGGYCEYFSEFFHAGGGDRCGWDGRWGVEGGLQLFDGIEIEGFEELFGGFDDDRWRVGSSFREENC